LTKFQAQSKFLDLKSVVDMTFVSIQPSENEDIWLPKDLNHHVMKRIIVPIDFSSYSENAFLTAARIALKTGSRITCVNVVSTLLDWNNLSQEAKRQQKEILVLEEEALESMKNFVRQHHNAGVAVDIAVEIGVPHRAILDVAQRFEADLIVIGAYGKGHEQGKYLGSNLQTVLRNATCPVLAVKKNMNGNDLRKMAFSSLFNEGSKAAFERMKPLLKAFQTKIHFVYVNTPAHFSNSEDAEIRMFQFAKGFEDLTIHKHVYSHQEIENGIVDFAEKNKIGFIGIASGNRKGTASYQIGVTDTVLFKSDIPVLSVKL
jgi:nucleotide-binding universal stress UspA family protein